MCSAHRKSIYNSVALNSLIENTVVVTIYILSQIKKSVLKILKAKKILN